MTERVEYTKRTAILGKTHVEQSFFCTKESCASLRNPKAKVDSLLTRTADCFPSSNKALKKKGVTLPPQRDHVRTEGFLYWL